MQSTARILNSQYYQHSKIPSSAEEKDPLRLALIKLEDNYQKLMELSLNKKIWQALPPEQKIENEKDKIDIIKKVNEMLNFQYLKNHKPPLRKEKPAGPFYRKALYWFLLITNVFAATAGCYLGFVSILGLIPGITALAIKLTAGFGTAIEGLMVYSSLKPGMKDALKMQHYSASDSLLSYQGHRLDLVAHLNNKMLKNDESYKAQGATIYSYYISICKTLNLDIKKLRITPYSESKLKKTMRFSLSALSFALGIAGIYFGVAMLIAGISTALVGTPVGWGLLGILVCSQLITRFITRNNFIYQFLNPSTNEHEEVYKKLIRFKDRSNDYDQEYLTLKRIDRAEKMEIKQALTQETAVVPNQKTQEEPVFLKPGDYLSEKMRSLAILEQPKRVPFQF